MTPDLKKLLAEAEALDKAATPGPWRQGRLLMTERTRHYNRATQEGLARAEGEAVFAFFTPQDEGRSRIQIARVYHEQVDAIVNREFIMRSRTLLSEFVKAIEELMEGKDAKR